MSSGDITRYVVTINLHEASLTELNELNNAFTRANFLLTLTDDEGNIHDLGTLTFGRFFILFIDDQIQLIEIENGEAIVHC